MTLKKVVERLQGNLVVSCQASKGEPLAHPGHILAMSLTALNGGAQALRLEGVENVAFVRQALDKIFSERVPIIGLTKADLSEEERLTHSYITASYDEAEALARAGADIIALDATGRKRADNLNLTETVELIHRKLACPVWADCATIDDATASKEAGCDIVSTTLYGYTSGNPLPATAGPDFELLSAMVALGLPTILEGRVWHPSELAKAFERGAHAVVVGSAITRPALITARFVDAIPQAVRESRVHPPVDFHYSEI